jgi:hypothetical protein
MLYNIEDVNCHVFPAFGEGNIGNYRVSPAESGGDASE